MMGGYSYGIDNGCSQKEDVFKDTSDSREETFPEIFSGSVEGMRLGFYGKVYHLLR